MKAALFVTRSMLGILGISRFVARNPQSVSAIIVFPNIPHSVTSSTEKVKKMSQRIAWQVIAYKVFETYVYYACRCFFRRTTLSSLAKKYNIPLVCFRDPNEQNALNYLKSLSPDLIVNLSPAILKKEVLGIPSQGCINFHGAKLPEYRGVANYFWSMILGSENWTATLHRMALGVDEGNILKEATTAISIEDSVHSVNQKVIQLCPGLLETLFHELQTGNLVEKMQSKNEGAYRSFPTAKDVKLLRAQGRKILPLSHFLKSVMAD